MHQDTLPLPAVTGAALADYVRVERPKTTNQAVFVRVLAPHDQPLGPHASRTGKRRHRNPSLVEAKPAATTYFGAAAQPGWGGHDARQRGETAGIGRGRRRQSQG